MTETTDEVRALIDDPDAPPRWAARDEECRLIDMLAKTGATYRQLDYWWRCGYFAKPGIDPATASRGPGSGRNRIWTGREQRIVELMVRLSFAGITSAALSARMARDAVDSNALQISPAEGITILLRAVA